MELVLTKDVQGLGRRGELVKVSDGYGNNFLLKKGLAQMATQKLVQQIAKEEKDKKDKQEKAVAHAVRDKEEIEKRIFTIKVKVGANGTIFGAVREKEIATAVSKKLNREIDKSDFQVPTPIKTLGSHSANLKLPGNLIAKINLDIQAE